MLSEFCSSDCEELSRSLANTKQMYRQTGTGQFFGRWRRLQLPGVTIVENEINFGIHNSAAISDGFVIGFLPVRQGGTLILDGHCWDSPCVFWAQPKTRPILSIPSDFMSYTVEFDLQRLYRTANALGISLPSSNGDLGCISNPASCAAARDIIAQAFCAGADCSAPTLQQHADQFMTDWLHLLGQASGCPQPVDRSTLHQRRQAALKAADYMNTHLCEDLSLADLCQIAGVTDRTLRNGFHDLFGISPKRWLKAQRLSAARRDLKEADPKRDHVGTIAIKYGFTQLAHFATDYRKQFGEPPSHTLRS